MIRRVFMTALLIQLFALHAGAQGISMEERRRTLHKIQELSKKQSEELLAASKSIDGLTMELQVITAENEKKDAIILDQQQRIEALRSWGKEQESMANSQAEWRKILEKELFLVRAHLFRLKMLGCLLITIVTGYFIFRAIGVIAGPYAFPATGGISLAVFALAWRLL